jgi:hypothetical protein
VLCTTDFSVSIGLVERLRKDRDRSDNENNGEDGAAVTIDLLGPLCLLIVMQNCRQQNLNQAKENK